MTKQSRRPKQSLVRLKIALLTGSLIATLAGAVVLGRQEVLDTATTAPTNQTITVLPPANAPTTVQLPPSSRRTQVQLQPIPQAIQPRINPIARTRSSR
jgi:hypothetical protein